MNICILPLYNGREVISSSNVCIFKYFTAKIDYSCEHPKIDTTRGY